MIPKHMNDCMPTNDTSSSFKPFKKLAQGVLMQAARDLYAPDRMNGNIKREIIDGRWVELDIVPAREFFTSEDKVGFWLSVIDLDYSQVKEDLIYFVENYKKLNLMNKGKIRRDLSF